AEEAVAWYLSIFPESQVTRMTRYTDAGYDVHRMPPGSIMTVEFELEGEALIALNGGPSFRFTEAISLQIDCDTQAEVDFYWDRLSAGSDPASQRCGWLKDQYGLFWQVVPGSLMDLLADPDPARGQRVMAALLDMKKIDVLELRRIAGQA
ncbi:MAG: VOC family protein, partial [Ignavibacteria bacterium]